MPDFLIYFIVILCGLVIGSFLSALTYRMPEGISIKKGRSFCPKCKRKISWSDNIPIISFYLLKGKCRNCGVSISLRYPMIEFFTVLVFLLLTVKQLGCRYYSSSFVDPVCSWNGLIGNFNFIFLLFISSVLISIFVIDLERKIIPDKLSLGMLSITLLMFIFFNPDHTYRNIFIGFSSGAFLLFVHLVTKGKGMGLGDVKLVIPLGLFLGWPHVLVWFFLSFVIGSIVGLFMITAQKTSFGKEIPFGPFLIFGFFLTLIWGDNMIKLFF